MNAAAAGWKDNMKERFQQNSAQEFNPMTNAMTTPCSPQILGLQETLLSSGWRRRFEPSPPSQVAQDTVYPALPLQHLHWSKCGVSEEGRAVICSPLPRGSFFSRDSEVLLSAGRHINNACLQLALQNPHTVVCGVYGKFEIPDILHMQDTRKENSQMTPQWVNFSQQKSKGN